MKKILLLVVSTSLFYFAAHTQPLVGLENVGNSCFMNAALQCLGNLPLLVQALQKKQEGFYKSDTLSDLFIHDFLSQFTQTNKEILNPLAVCLKGWQALKLPEKSSQDAAEFIDVLFNHLTDLDVNDQIKKELPLYPHTTQPKTNISDLIMSMVVSTVLPELAPPLREEECPISTRIEPMSVLRLPVEKSHKTLSDCLQEFFQESLLAGENSYKCPNEVSVNALKLLSLQSSPHYLMLGLNRTIFSRNTLHLIKEDTPISFPLEHLSLLPYYDTSSVSNPTDYTLVSFIMHRGEPAAGHYTAYIKRGNQWYFCDDTSIVPIPFNIIQSIAERGYGYNTTYLLSLTQEDEAVSKTETPVLFFYEKNDNLAPLPISNEEASVTSNVINRQFSTPLASEKKPESLFNRIMEESQKAFQETYQEFGYTQEDLDKISREELELITQRAQEKVLANFKR